MRLNLDILRLRSEPATFPKTRSVSLRVAWLVLTPALSYAILADAPLFAILPAVALAPAVIIRKPVAVTVRAAVYSGLFALLVVSLVNQAYKLETDRFFLPVDLTMPGALTVAICAAYWTQTRGTLTLLVVLSLFAMLTHGTCLNDPRFVRLASLNGSIWENRFFVYGLFTASETVAMMSLWGRLRPAHVAVGGRRRDWRRLTRLGFAWVLLAATTSGMAVFSVWAYDRVDPMFNQIFLRYLQMRMQRNQMSRDVNLWQSPPAREGREALRPVLRLRAERAPQYLRARGFLAYNGGTWQGGGENISLPGHTVPGNEMITRFSRFAGRPIGGATHRLDFYPAESFRSDVLFLPGGGARIELVSPSLVQRPEDGAVLPDSDWDRGAGYTLLAATATPAQTFPLPREPRGPQWLQVPPDVRPELEALLRGPDGALPATPEATVRRVYEILGGPDLRYELGVELRGRRDPVVQFLGDLKAGHCELFASAAVLLLRTGGVPARYVTGAVVAEPHLRDHWWIVRTRDLHAWAEAWLPDRGGWTLIETTPASGIPADRAPVAVWRGAFEYPRTWLAQVMALIKRGYFAAAVIGFFVRLGRGLAWLLFTGPWFVSWPVLALAFWLGWRYWWQRRRWFGPTAAAADRVQLLAVWHRLEDYLHARGIDRGPATSLGEVAARVREHLAADAPVLGVLGDYERLRYRPEPPPAAAVDALAERIARLPERHG